MARRKAPRIPDAILDQLLAGADPKTAFEADGLLDELKKALAERALNAEMDHHLAGEDAGNTCNGYGRKTVTIESGRIELAIPRDRQATFDPQLIARYQRRFPGFDDKIVSMYARGMSTREIVAHLRELYGIEVSPDLISAVTDAVLEEVALVCADGDVDDLVRRLEAFREVMARSAIPIGHGIAIPVTISIGVARRHRGQTFRDLYVEADKALYVAKTSGRNRVVMAEPSASASGPSQGRPVAA